MRLESFSQRSHRKLENYRYHQRVKRLNMKTGVVHKVLFNNAAIPANTILASGVEIIRVAPGRHSFGSPDEQLGVIIEIYKVPEEERNIDFAAIKWSDGSDGESSLNDLLAFSDLQSYCLTNQISLVREPKYHIDQVLFVKPSRDSHSAAFYPAVGSPHETDVKVTKVEVSTFGNVITYQVYIPSVGYVNFLEKSLITAKERERILHNDFKECFFTTDALPFFRRGERVKTYEGWLYNQDESVIVELNPELRSLLSWGIKQDE